MLKSRDPYKEDVGRIAFGVVLLLLWLFLSASVLSYTPWDLPTKFVYHENEGVGNLAGLLGAWCACLCSWFFGAGGYFLVLATGFGVLCYWLNWLTEVWLKTLGGFIMLVAVSTFSAYVIDGSSGSPIGPGGCVGALVKFLLDQAFIPLGSYVFLAGLFSAGLILILPLRTLSFLFWSTGLARAVVYIVAPFWRRIYAARPNDRPELPVGFNRETQPIGVQRPMRVGMNYVQTRSPGGSVAFTGSQRPQTGVIARSVASTFASDINSTSPTVLSQEATRYVEVNPSDFSPLPQSQTPLFTQSVKETLNAAFTDSVSPITPIEGDVLANVRSSSDGERTYSTLSPVDLKALKERADDYVPPPIELLKEAGEFDFERFREEINERGHELERACLSFGVELKVVDVQVGPVLTLYEIELKKGLRVGKLNALTKDLEIAMKAEHVRIVSPIPGKNTVGVELPNQTRQTVRLREVIEACAREAGKMEIPIFLGKDVAGAPMVADLAQLPHLLIAGRTGTGKSVCLNSIIMSILMTRSPKQCKLIMIDPKMVELSPYKSIPHLAHSVVVDMEKAAAVLEWATEEMERRYAILARVGARKLSEFNKMPLDVMRSRLRPRSAAEWLDFPKTMPNIVIIADEMADLIMTSGKEVERHIIRLTQKSRAVGIHLALATQKPTVDVVTGLIKSNLPARISFAVATRTDSHVVLDSTGAEQLLGNGDMLFLQPNTSVLVRGQGAYVDDDEINAVIKSISVDEPDFIFNTDTPNPKPIDGDDSDVQIDEYYLPAVDFVIGEGRASTSLLQRKFSIGYSRASRIIDMMAADGIISPFNPAKPSRARDILITMEQWNSKQSDSYEQTQNVIDEDDGYVGNSAFDASPQYFPSSEVPSDVAPFHTVAPVPFATPPVPKADGDVAMAAPSARPTSEIVTPEQVGLVVPVEPRPETNSQDENEDYRYQESSYESSPISDTHDADLPPGPKTYREFNLAPNASEDDPESQEKHAKEESRKEVVIDDESVETEGSAVPIVSQPQTGGWSDEDWNRYMDGV